MKLMYKVMLFLAIIQMTILIVNATGVFPKDGQFYSDTEISADVDPSDNAWNVTQAFFVPSENAYIGNVGIGAIVLLFVGAGAIGAWITHSFIPVVIIFQCYIFFNMMLNSMGFVEKMFYNWNSNAMIYLAICLGVGIFIIFLITIVESPTHGRSG